MRLLAVLLFFLAFPSQADPVQVRVGIYLLQAGRLEVATGSYTLDFYLFFRCEQECDPSHFEFTNGRVLSKQLLSNGPPTKIWRVHATFMSNLDLRAYLFDTHADHCNRGRAEVARRARLRGGFLTAPDRSRRTHRGLAFAASMAYAGDGARLSGSGEPGVLAL